AISAGLLSVVACKKETTTTSEITNDTLSTETVVTEETTIDPAIQAQIDEAKANHDTTEADVKAAIEKGDKKAEEAAIKVRDEAKSSWEKVKDGVNNTAQDVKDGINNAADKVEEGAEKVGEKAKEVSKNVEEGYNKTLDKMKTNN